MEDVKAALRRFIEQNFVLGAGGLKLEDGDSFLDHHVLDSTGFLELVAFVRRSGRSAPGSSAGFPGLAYPDWYPVVAEQQAGPALRLLIPPPHRRIILSSEQAL